MKRAQRVEPGEGAVVALAELPDFARPPPGEKALHFTALARATRVIE